MSALAPVPAPFGIDGLMDVYWLEQSEADVPAENQWLSEREISCLQGMRFTKRRTDWRLGRWTAKCTLAACLDRPIDLHALADIEILAAPSGAPEVLLLNQKTHIGISLSHRAGAAMCAVAMCGDSLGCDLEIVEPRSDAFIADYFTVTEQALVEQAPLAERPLLVNLLWSAKESTLKALRAGLRLDTRCVEVIPAGTASLQTWVAPALDTWFPLHVLYCDSQLFHGWWRHTKDIVRTVASMSPLRLDGVFQGTRSGGRRPP